MPPVVIDLHSTEDPRDAVHRAVQALAEGRLVALPTETSYTVAASALCESAVKRMGELGLAARLFRETVGAPGESPTNGEKESSDNNGSGSAAAREAAPGRSGQSPHRVAFAVKSADDALDYVPNISPLAMRLARRCWPGPVTLVLKDEHPDSVVKQLAHSVQATTLWEGDVSLRVPAHAVVLSVLRLAQGPVALVSALAPASSEGQEDGAAPAEAITAQEVISGVGGDIDLVLDDGRSKFGQPCSLVRVSERRVEILRAGVFSESALRRLSSLMVVFVCTGNTCRSPMAEILMKRRLAQRLGCSIDSLEDRGVIVASAGIAAMSGGRSADEAVHTMRERGLDLSRHETQPLSERLLRCADFVLTMTRSHRGAIIAQWPEAADRVHMVCRDYTDVADPIGGAAEDYRACADQIDGLLEPWVDEIDLSALPIFNSAPPA